jgi:hypothetical protein
MYGAPLEKCKIFIPPRQTLSPRRTVPSTTASCRRLWPPATDRHRPGPLATSGRPPHPGRRRLRPGRVPLRAGHHWRRPTPLSRPPLRHRPVPPSQPTAVRPLPSRSPGLDTGAPALNVAAQPLTPALDLCPVNVFFNLYWIWVKFEWKLAMIEWFWMKFVYVRVILNEIWVCKVILDEIWVC